MGMPSVVTLGGLALLLGCGIAGCTSGTNPVVDEEPQAPPTPLGMLAIDIVGLEGVIHRTVEITGPTIFHRTAISDTVFRGLMPGPYVIEGKDVLVGGQSYSVFPAFQGVTVKPGETAAVVVQYGQSSAFVTVNVSGVPVGVTPFIHLEGPDGLSSGYSGSFTAGPLATGLYTVRPEPVYVDQERFNPPSPQTVYLATGGTTLVTLRYAQGTGPFTVTIDGLPAGADAAVRITREPGFDGDDQVFDQFIPASLTLHGMEIGYYNVIARSVTTSSGIYVPSPDSNRTFVTPTHPGEAVILYALMP